MTPPTTCPLCSAASPSATGRTHLDSGTTYTQYGCATCQVEFWWPLKNPGATWYSNNERYGNRNHDPVWAATGYHKQAARLLGKKKQGTILDVGCGIGNFLAIVNEDGWKCSGIDFDPDAIVSAKKRTGITDLEVADVVSYAAREPKRQFDAITFFDVFEHVDNHNEFIEAIRSMLPEGGRIAMSMPYRYHALWLMRGDVPPCHLTCWDEPSLRMFLERHGFKVTMMRRRTEGVWPIVMKLRFRYGKNISFGAVRAVRQSLGDTVQNPGKRPVMVRVVQMLAKVKDAVIFGIPAVLIYLSMLPSKSRYVTLFAIAEKTSAPGK